MSKDKKFSLIVFSLFIMGICVISLAKKEHEKKATVKDQDQVEQKAQQPAEKEERAELAKKNEVGRRIGKDLAIKEAKKLKKKSEEEKKESFADGVIKIIDHIRGGEDKKAEAREENKEEEVQEKKPSSYQKMFEANRAKRSKMGNTKTGAPY